MAIQIPHEADIDDSLLAGAGGARGRRPRAIAARDLLGGEDDPHARVHQAVAALRNGEMLVVVADPGSGLGGALVTAAERVSNDVVNFFITCGRGPLYVAMEPERLASLKLEQVRPHVSTHDQAALHVPVDHRGTATGLSTADRAATILALADPASGAEDFRIPGHVFPVSTRQGGVLERSGHTEASVDLLRLAHLRQAALTCTILAADGSPAGTESLRAFAAEHALRVVRIADLVRYRRANEDVIERVGETVLPTPEGPFLAIGYADRFEPGEHLALVMGKLARPEPLIVRIHTDCLVGDAFGSMLCGCHSQLRASMREIAEHGRGVLLYVRSPDGDRGRWRHLEAAAGAPAHCDERALDASVTAVARSMLRDLGVAAERVSVEARS